MKIVKYMATAASFLLMAVSCSQSTKVPSEVKISKADLQDKIKGAWAGQTIGCTYGGPTEFRYSGMMINENIDIAWPDGYIKWYYDNQPGLYDDIYMDLTFVDVFQKEGLDAPIESFANAFANADYMLWHANQQARYNIQQGIMPPQSGHWTVNPHADDIDFQIEADYAGIMSPGMVNAASHYCDEIGHMMNYGDGWYGGVYVAAMYALAFVSDDINYVTEEALKVIPEQSNYYKCMADVIAWHKAYPDNWEITWALVDHKYGWDIGCPSGVNQAFNIDAVINSAYILIGLLYGQKDFAKTIDIATRCGCDSDCNPASAGGILGTMLGYSNIPEYWKKNLYEVEDIDFAYTTISLNDVYAMSFDQALQVIERNGGSVSENDVTIKVQAPQAVRLEQSFEGHWPVATGFSGGFGPSTPSSNEIREAAPIEFDGKGIVVNYSFNLGRSMAGYGLENDDDYVAVIEAYLDGQLCQTINLPAKGKNRREELFNQYNLPNAHHTLTFKWLNPEKGRNIYLGSNVIYTERPQTAK